MHGYVFLLVVIMLYINLDCLMINHCMFLFACIVLMTWTIESYASWFVSSIDLRLMSTWIGA